MAFLPNILIAPPRSRRHHAIRCALTNRPPTIASDFRPATFHIEKTVMPADSDYSMALWHGSYVRWLEEARVQYLNYIDLPYEQLVQLHHTELVVRDLNVRYLSPARLGDELFITISLQYDGKVRIPIQSEFIKANDGTVFATAQVTLAAIDMTTGKLRRKWPQVLTDAISK